VKWPCFYGIDFASRAELIANGLTTDEICNSIGADSLAYVDLDALIEATLIDKDRLCRACFDGIYPVELPEPELLGKHVLEGIERRVVAGASADAEGVATLMSGGAADALERP
jgi:amidophosphoribosyltransferase